MADYVTKEELRRVLDAGMRGEFGQQWTAALAALSPAPAKACSGFVCGYDDGTGDCWHDSSLCGDTPECHCTNCGQLFSAHQQEQAQQPAPKLRGCPNCGDQWGQCDCPIPQPAPTALPELVAWRWTNGAMVQDAKGGWCHLSDAQAYQRECERLRGENALLRDDGNAAVHEAAVWMDKCHAAEQRAEQTEAELAQARAEERERCDKAITAEAVRVDIATQHLDSNSRGGIAATARVAALYAARDLIRALGGEAGE